MPKPHHHFRTAARSSQWFHLLAGCALTPFLAAGPALAQEDTTVFALEEITVTATKRAVSQQDVPIAINTLTADMIDKIGASDLRTLENATPSMSMGRAERGNRGEVTIRGVGDWARNAGMDARAGVYVDGVYMGRAAGANQSLFDIERVEVLRGPQGTLFGKNTVSGAINIATKAPNLDEIEGELSASYGNYNETALQGRISVPLSNGVSAVSASIAKLDRDGHITNLANDSKINGQDTLAGRLKARLQATDALSIDLAFDFLDEKVAATNAEATGPGGGDVQFLLSLFGLTEVPGADDIYVIGHDAEEYEERDVWGLSTTINYAFENEYELTLIAAYREAGFGELDEEDYTPIPLAYSELFEDNEQTSLELRLSSPRTERYDFVAGVYYYSSDVVGRQTGSIAFVGDVVSNSSASTESIAAYINGNIRFADSFELNLGARYTQEDKALDYAITDSTGLFTNASRPGNERSENNFAPRVGLNYFAGENTMLYASWSLAHKSGGWNADYLDDISIAKFEFDEEKATSYELGIKSELMDRRLRANIALFQTDFDDFQVFQYQQDPGSGSTVIIFDNAGKVRTKGIETELSALVSDSLTLTANFAYVDATFSEFRDAGRVDGELVDFDGNRLPYSPKWKVFLAADYETQIGSNWLSLHLDYSHSGDMYGNADNQAPNLIPSFDTVNAHASFRFEEQGTELFAYARNLFDSNHIRSKNLNFFAIPRAVYAVPATYGVGARWKF